MAILKNYHQNIKHYGPVFERLLEVQAKNIQILIIWTIVFSIQMSPDFGCPVFGSLLHSLNKTKQGANKFDRRLWCRNQTAYPDPFLAYFAFECDMVSRSLTEQRSRNFLNSQMMKTEEERHVSKRRSSKLNASVCNRKKQDRLEPINKCYSLVNVTCSNLQSIIELT